MILLLTVCVAAVVSQPLQVIQVVFNRSTRYTISSSTDASLALITFWIWLVVVFAERMELTRLAIFEFVAEIYVIHIEY